MQLKIEIVNLVATASLGERIDLEGLGELSLVNYDPTRYFCAYFKDETMEAKVSIFNSGKMIAVGAKSEEAARRDLMKVVKVLSKLGIVKKSRPVVTVQNVVITAELGSPINLEELQSVIPGFVYEPEQFPGAIFRPIDSDVTVLVFASGKMVVAGLRSVSFIPDNVQTVLS